MGEDDIVWLKKKDTPYYERSFGQADILQRIAADASPRVVVVGVMVALLEALRQ